MTTAETTPEPTAAAPDVIGTARESLRELAKGKRTGLLAAIRTADDAEVEEVLGALLPLVASAVRAPGDPLPPDEPELGVAPCPHCRTYVPREVLDTADPCPNCGLGR